MQELPDVLRSVSGGLQPGVLMTHLDQGPVESQKDLLQLSHGLPTTHLSLPLGLVRIEHPLTQVLEPQTKSHVSKCEKFANVCLHSRAVSFVVKYEE